MKINNKDIERFKATDLWWQPGNGPKGSYRQKLILALIKTRVPIGVIIRNFGELDYIKAIGGANIRESKDGYLFEMPKNIIFDEPNGIWGHAGKEG